MSRIAVIGAGAWGTAIGIVLGRRGGHEVALWAHEPEVRESINVRHVNELFLAGCPIPAIVAATNSLEEALRGTEIVISVMPSHHTRRVFTAMRPHLHADMLFVSATKGIENDSLLRMSEVIGDVLCGLSPRIGALSGPHRGAHHPRPGRDHPPRCCLWRPRRNHGRTRRPRRFGSHLHRRALA